MAVWDELKVVLVRLRAEQPDALQQYPDPTSEYAQPPFAIGLAPWAVAIADDLHRRFGDGVDLTVGLLAYPAREPRWPLPGRSPAELLDLQQVTVDLDGPALVRSGHTARHGLLVHNLTGENLEIATNGQVTAEIVEPETGRMVGIYAGAQHMPLIVFGVPPGQTTRIPLLIGTAGLAKDIGYAVPPGTWGLQATLDLGPDPVQASSRRTPVLPITVAP